MINIMNVKCLNCDSQYFKSISELNHAMYSCIGCARQLSFPGANPDITLIDKREEDIFDQLYKGSIFSFIKEKIYKERNEQKKSLEKLKQEKIEKKEKEEQIKIEKEQKELFINNERKQAKVNELKQIFENNYLESRLYFKENLLKWINDDEFHSRATEFVRTWFIKENLEAPDFEQAAAIANVWDNIQVIARAGSGKTRTIINRTIFLIKHCKIHPSEILILAFNKKAADEVKERLKKVLDTPIPEAMTFHALAYAIVHPKEKLIFDEVEKLEKSDRVQEVIDSYLQNHKSNDYHKIKKLMMNYFKQDWDEIINKGYNLAPEDMLQYRRSLPYLGLDGALYKSMGEKRIADYLFEHNIPYKYERNFWWDGLNYKPDFTIEKEWNGYNGYKGIVIEYFGMTGKVDYNIQTKEKIKYWNRQSEYKFLSMFPKDAETDEITEHYLEGNLKRYYGNIVKLSEEDIWHRIKERSIYEFSEVCSSFIGRCRKLMLTSDDLKDLVIAKKHQLSDLELQFLRVVWKIYRDYINWLRKNDEEDFDGLMQSAITSLKSSAVNWSRKNSSGSLKHLKYLFIDEYQDFSLLFYELTNEIKKKNHDIRLFCVGDDWQSINGFAGSDLKYFHDFKKYYKDSTSLHLSTNYRSKSKIVEAGNKLMNNKGFPSKPFNLEKGKINIFHLDEFNPSKYERDKFKGDRITPALIRIVKSIVDKGESVSLLSRRKNNIPFYINYQGRNQNFQTRLIKAIRNEFPEKKRHLIKAVSTVHSFKGKEDDSIIILDAVDRSFPLLHPRNVFFEVLGQTMFDVLEEEQRLFYVGITRAKSNLIIVTETHNISPYLSKITSNKLFTKLNVDNLHYPIKQGSSYKIIISNYKSNEDGTYSIKSFLKAYKYNWNPASKSWNKNVAKSDFHINNLYRESWLSKSNNISIKIEDEFYDIIYLFKVIKGKLISIENRLSVSKQGVKNKDD